MKKIFTLLFLSTPIWLVAQGYQVHVQGQKQQAMGNAGSALIQDGAAVFYNPGGVSFLKEKSTITAGGNAAIVNSVFVDSTVGTLTRTKTPVSIPFTFYGVFGFDTTSSKALQNLKISLGVYTPFGGGVVYPDTGWIGQNIVKSMSLKTLCFQPTVSYKLNKMLGVGVGFVYSMGSLQKKMAIAPLNNTDATNSEIKAKLNGYGFNAGIYFNPTEALSIGLTYRSQINMKSKDGVLKTTGIPTILADSIPASNKISTTIPMPKVITLGAAYKVNDKLTLAADICFVGFKVFDSLHVKFDKNPGPGQSNPKVEPRKYNNVYTFQLGGQYKITDQLAARLGLRYAMSPIPKGFVSPEGADVNHFIYCAGLGYQITDNFAVDVSYSFESIKRADNNLYYHFSGTYKTYASIVGLSLSYNF